jgi:FkbM family methyltransferase
MHSYSQNSEQKIILNYFGDYRGQFLDIGANDGITLSNTYALALKGWDGVLVEPSSKAFRKLGVIHEDRPNMLLFEVAISNFVGESEFFESGEHLSNLDVALLSTLKKEELKRWEGSNNTFKEKKVNVWTFDLLQERVLAHGGNPQYQFISIDAEGCDMIILKQIDLNEVGCSCICIEHNSNKDIEKEIVQYCAGFGLTNILTKNAENIILSL